VDYIVNEDLRLSGVDNAVRIAYDNDDWVRWAAMYLKYVKKKKMELNDQKCDY